MLDSCTENMNQLRAEGVTIKAQQQQDRQGLDQEQNVSTQQLLFSVWLHFSLLCIKYVFVNSNITVLELNLFNKQQCVYAFGILIHVHREKYTEDRRNISNIGYNG